MKKHSWWLCLVPLYLFTLLFVLGPMLYLLLLSFATDHSSGYGFHWQFTLENFRRILDPLYLNCFIQSFKLAFTTTAISILIGYPFGYYMGKLPPKGKRLLLFLLMIPFWTSSLIRIYGWLILLQVKGLFNAVLLGFGVVDTPVKLLYTYPAVVIGMVYALLPFMILAVYSSVEKMDWSLVEASRDLGASPIKAFLTVTLKLTLPGLLSGVILTFVPSMGLFFIADILGGNKVVLVGSLIQDQVTRGSNWPFAAALAVVLTLMTTCMLLLYRRVLGEKEESA